MIFTVTPNPVLDRTLTVPHIEFNTVTRATATRLDWGGKGFNVSRALQALGVKSTAMGFVGGAPGRQLEEGLNRTGITTDLIHIQGETRTNIVITEANGPETNKERPEDREHRYIKVNEAGPAVTPDEATRLLERVRTKVHRGDVWALCGSLPPGLPPDFYAQLVTVIQQYGARAMLDSSGEALRMGCGRFRDQVPAPYLVKPNIKEAESLSGHPIESERDAMKAITFFLDQGIKLVALSMGADGLLLASEETRIWAKPPQVQALNPVGAGDALLAGLIWALRRGTSLEEMARWGVATGTAAAMREGVSVGTQTEVKALYQQVDCVRMSG
jgi:1-phosphofructokinase family hexose kinase